MMVINAESAQDFVKAWAGAGPQRRMTMFEVAAAAMHANAILSGDERPAMRADYMAAERVLREAIVATR